jgi:hypothetical protein
MKKTKRKKTDTQKLILTVERIVWAIDRLSDQIQISRAATQKHYDLQLSRPRGYPTARDG